MAMAMAEQELFRDPPPSYIRQDRSYPNGAPAKRKFEDQNPARQRPCSRSDLLNRIKVCGKQKNVSVARAVHADVLERDLLLRDSHVANGLITAYSRCGDLDRARALFDQLPVPDVVSWNALITGYAQNGFGYEALECYREMQNAEVIPNVVTYVSVLKACGIFGSLEIGENIDGEIRKKGLLVNDSVLGTALVDMYSKCGKLEKAQEVFENLPVRNVVTWTTIIAGYVRHGLGNEALRCFTQMQVAGVHPDAVTYVYILKACGIAGSLSIGEDISAQVEKKKLLQRDIVVGNALVDMYCKCGAVERAQQVFWHLPRRDVVTWSALIAGYVHNGLGDKALECFRQMQDAGIIPDAITYVSSLKACSIVGSLEIGKDIDNQVRKLGLLRRDVVLGTALMDMYFRCGVPEKAQEVFNKLPPGNIVAWSSIIAGYVQNGLADEAQKCFRQMQDARVLPDNITYLSILKACGIVGSLKFGEDIAAEIRKKRLLQNDVALGTALVDMYSKCGAVDKAQAAFEHLPVQDTVSWTALIAGYTQLGEANVVLRLYRNMREAKVMPGVITFILLLTACSHSGLMKQGEILFHEMCTVYYLAPILEHYMCMIDLYVRAGHIDKVKALIEKVSDSDRFPLFLAVLSACRQWKDVRVGRWAFEQLVQLEGKCAAAYVCMEKIYAAAGTSRSSCK